MVRFYYHCHFEDKETQAQRNEELARDHRAGAWCSEMWTQACLISKSLCFPKWLHHFTFLSAKYEGLQFFHIHANTCYFLFQDYSHPRRCEVVSCVVLICIFLMTNDPEHLFMGSLATVHLLWRNVCSSPCPFSNWIVCLLLLFVFQSYSLFYTSYICFPTS